MDRRRSAAIPNVQIIHEPADETVQQPPNPNPTRRTSIAATLHANIIGLTGHPDAFDNARRRLSNVGDVVSRKISRTIGWRTLGLSLELTVSQGTSLCAQYMRSRLKREGIYQRKFGLKQSAKLLAGDTVITTDFCPELVGFGAELEKMHPSVYERVGRQIGINYFVSEQRVTEAFLTVANAIVRQGDLTWSKLVAIYAVAGGLACDVVKQGKPDYLAAVQRGMNLLLDDGLAIWIHSNGGWSTFSLRYRAPDDEETGWQTSSMILFIAGATILVSILSLLMRVLLL